MTDTPLATVDEVVDALGGTTAAANLCGVSLSAVSNWRADREFPERVHHRIFRLCRDRNIAVAEGLFEARPKGMAANVA